MQKQLKKTKMDENKISDLDMAKYKIGDELVFFKTNSYMDNRPNERVRSVGIVNKIWVSDDGSGTIFYGFEGLIPPCPEINPSVNEKDIIRKFSPLNSNEKKITFKMMSRVERFIFDPNVYLLRDLNLNLGLIENLDISFKFRTELIIYEDDSFDFINRFDNGDSVETHLDLRDYEISQSDFINAINKLEEQFVPEKILSTYDMIEFLKRAK